MSVETNSPQKSIGIDFDNTIVCYDTVFYLAALEKNWIPPSIAPNKTAVRDYFRSIKQEEKWTELQGYVYGARMDLATPFPDVSHFFNFCKNQGVKISIISHRTKHPYIGPNYDLHAAALDWLGKQLFFNPQIEAYFEPTLQSKLQRINSTQCGLFIDDLPELLEEPLFPAHVQKILFDPNHQYQKNPKWTRITSWKQAISLLQI